MNNPADPAPDLAALRARIAELERDRAHWVDAAAVLEEADWHSFLDMETVSSATLDELHQALDALPLHTRIYYGLL